MKKILLLVSLLFLVACQPATDDDTTQKKTDDELTNEETVENGDDKEEDAEDQADLDQESEPETDQGIEQGEGGTYSSDDAIILVQEYLNDEGVNIDMNYVYDGDDEQGHYRVQVFEVIGDGDGESHTATYGWYIVDPETGEVTDLFD
ncbi:hypothetical protein [Amphibacillus cookii]|uniref:hypothetical protein n=1 Tax=Amphibacillus cookii TaxID=767787 RepID=UPI0019561DB5|nr:hypothetical protein [Amphibacillus cookii]MBM7542663.1 cobalamin biosynthesis protein CobT [Amphibacillus cookii]